MKEIESKWKTTTAGWNKEINKFENHEEQEEIKIIKMTIDTDSKKPILRFIEGPTGYESYYIEDLIRHCDLPCHTEDFNFCICGGTVNSWPQCTVKKKDMFEFLKEQGYL